MLVHKKISAWFFLDLMLHFERYGRCVRGSVENLSIHIPNPLHHSIKDVFADELVSLIRTIQRPDQVLMADAVYNGD